MPSCLDCGADLALDSRFCSRCGRPASSASEMETLANVSPVTPRRTPTPPSRSGFDSSPDARFAPGAILADRYRIVAALGRGGMGEVYRADDLKLGHPVAIKFLPRDLAADPRLLDRFHAEVRNSRQVSHPNVCRVYDIGEVDGQQFLTMEYIDGEDLASLLRRIGRLPADKAVETAHQICAGLAAAHDAGVLHRDLKPANIMLDGRGRARITDFGLAVTAEEAGSHAGMVAGTPAYMAPEQARGAPATVASDIYSLGLVLWEIFTGKRFDPAAAARDAADTKTSGSSRISSVPRRSGQADSSGRATHSLFDLDPAVERAILRCLDADPAKRPASALQVSAALPGGDPLAAALAAGETPSPEMVAAAGEEIAVSVPVATMLLMAIFVMLALLVPLARLGTFIGLAPSVKPREVLEARADEIAKRAAYTGTVRDSYQELSTSLIYAGWLAETAPADPYRKLGSAVPDVYRFTYRSSPQSLFAYNSFSNPTADDPPFTVPGMALVVLDGEGRLLTFRVVPPADDKDLPTAVAPDWPGLFAAGGWDFADFKPAEPHALANVAFDARAAWDGTARGTPLHVEAASLRGRPVSFAFSGPWLGRSRGGGGSSLASQLAFDFLILVALPLFGGILARRNVRLGRGDPAGATRLSIIVVLVIAVNTLLAQHWVAHPSILNDVIANAGLAFIFAIAVWVGYVAVEPLLRRQAPHLMISWARLLSGRFGDALVGRDMLIGSTAAVSIAAIHMLVVALPWWFPARGYLPYPGTATLSDTPHFVGSVLSQVWVAILVPLSIAFSYAVVRRLVRKPWLAAIVLYAIVWPLSFNSEGLFLQLTVGTIGSLVFVFIFLRFGLLALATEVLVENLIFFYPPVLRPDAWYFAKPLIVLLLVLAIVISAYRLALAGRPVLGPADEA